MTFAIFAFAVLAAAILAGIYVYRRWIEPWRLSRDLARWVTDVAAMKASGEPWQLVTTFSEWGEGTQVEASTEFGNAYLDALRAGLPSP